MLGQRKTVRKASSDSLSVSMVQPPPSSLGRRRGTRDRHRNGGSMMRTIVGGVALIVVGTFIGLFVGTVFIWPNVNDANSAVAANGNAVGGDSQQANKAGVDALFQRGKAALDQMKKSNTYLRHHPQQDHPVQVAGQGARPTYAGRQAVSGTNSKTKQEFLAHTPKIGTDGAFPYYPNGGSHNLVEPNHDFSTFKAQGGYRFDEYKHGDSPYTYSQGESDDLARSRRIHVKHAMQHAWGAYKTYAFGQDEVLPQSKSGHNNWGGMGTTLVDSLDTLWLMGMKDEFYEARDWCKSSLNHNIRRSVSVFETTIRSLGGLLSAYDWSGDDVFLDQAMDLGKRLFKAFDNPLGIPYGQVNLATGETSNIGWTGGNAITAEFGTLQLEFRLLARLSGIHSYKQKSEYVYDILKDLSPKDGLYPNFIRNRGRQPEFANDKITFGAMGDSLYEYMLKIWIQGGKTESKYRAMYDKAIQGMHDELLTLSTPSGYVFIADRNNGRIDTKMDHLVCFMGGALALGAYTDPLGLQSDRAQRDLKTAKVRSNFTLNAKTCFLGLSAVVCIRPFLTSCS